LTGLYKHNKNHSEGAPAPFVIHSDKARKKFEQQLSAQTKHGPVPPRSHKIPDRFKKGLFNEEENDEKERNPLGVSVSTSSKGSMTQVLFYQFCEHFVKSLPSHQGKNGSPVILFLDGHSSRWNVAALRYLMLNNVFPFFLASHTTIWSQPNDNGTIRRLHSCIAEVTAKHRRWNSTSIAYFNQIIVDAWELFIKRESSDLASGLNNATTSYAKTGLFPFNPLPDAWDDAIETLGLDNKLSPKKKSHHSGKLE